LGFLIEATVALKKEEGIMKDETTKLQKLASLGAKLQREVTANNADANSILQELIANVKALNSEFKGQTPRIIQIRRFGESSGAYQVIFSNRDQFATDIKHLFNQRTFQRLVLENLGFVPITVKDWVSFIGKFINTDKR
jgi:hypothetical protein